MRHAPGTGDDPVEPGELAGLEHPVGDVEDVRVPGELGEVVDDVVVDQPVGVVAREQAGPAHLLPGAYDVGARVARGSGSGESPSWRPTSR